MNDKARRLVAEALGLDPGEVGPELRAGGIEAWDSLAHLRVILALEAAIGGELGPDEIARIDSVGEVAKAIERHKDARPEAPLFRADEFTASFTLKD